VEPADKSYQYILVAAEPYETIAFKVFIIIIIIIIIIISITCIRYCQTASKFICVLHTHSLFLSLSLSLSLHQKQVPNQEIDTTASKFFTNWDFENKTFTLQVKHTMYLFL
jgi:hypothetical protein